MPSVLDDIGGWWSGSAKPAISQFFQGTPSSGPFIAPHQVAELDTLARQKAIRDILTTLGVAGAAGVGLGGIFGLKSFLGRRPSDTSRSPGPSMLQVPVPVYADKKEEEKARRLGLRKTAAPWWTMPGLLAAGVGGGYGGYRLVNWLMEKKRKGDLQDAIATAREQYQKALLEQYDPANVAPEERIPTLEPIKAATNKRESLDPISYPDGEGLQTAYGSERKCQGKTPELRNYQLLEDLDKMADAVADSAREVIEKRADLGETTLGALASLAGVLTLGSGILGYNWIKSRSTQKLLEEAIKQRERERAARRPPGIYAVPQPVRLTRRGELEASGPLVDVDTIGG